MKRGTAEHPKINRLAEALGIEPWGAAGVLELLWHFCCKFAVRGDVGRWTNKEIAAGIKWGDDPERLINALIDTGWIDIVDDPAVRLAIHDVSDHADNYWKECLRRSKKQFWNGKNARSGVGGRPKLPINDKLSIDNSLYDSEKPPQNLQLAAAKPLPSSVCSVISSSYLTDLNGSDSEKPPQKAGRQFTLSGGRCLIITDADWEKWLELKSESEVKSAVQKFVDHYSREENLIQYPAKVFELADAWVRGESTQGNKSDRQKRDFGFIPILTPTPEETDPGILCDVYQRAVKRGDDALIENAKKQPELWEKIQQELSRRINEQKKMGGQIEF